MQQKALLNIQVDSLRRVDFCTASIDDGSLVSLTASCLNSCYRASVRRWDFLQIMVPSLLILLSLKLQLFQLLDTFELLAEFAVGSDAITVADEGKWDDRHAQGQKGDETACPVNTQSIEHRFRGKGKHCSQNTTSAARRRLCTGR